MLEIIKSEDNNTNVLVSFFKGYLATIPEKIQNVEFSIRVKTVTGQILKKSIKVFANGSLHSKG